MAVATAVNYENTAMRILEEIVVGVEYFGCSWMFTISTPVAQNHYVYHWYEDMTAADMVEFLLQKVDDAKQDLKERDSPRRFKRFWSFI